jgi:hypothetical protein
MILLLWAAVPFVFHGEPSAWTSREKALAWFFFGGPFFLGLFNRSLTKREAIGWAVFFAILAAGIAFQQWTCLGLGRGQVCS